MARPKLPKVSEEMKRWSALLQTEVTQWPNTRTGKMFGLISVYRGKKIFALLPEARGFEHPNAIATKRNNLPGAEGKKWQTFIMETEADLTTALEHLHKAYTATSK